MSIIPPDRRNIPKSRFDIRLTEMEFKAIKERADKYCNGNMSAWFRYSALNMIPLGEHINKATSEQIEELSIGDLSKVAESNLDSE